METYKIIRYYAPNQHKRARIIKTHLSLEQAQEHCNNPNTRVEGVYFDGYTKEVRKWRSR
jgi:hypothetical protein